MACEDSAELLVGCFSLKEEEEHSAPKDVDPYILFER